MNYQNLENWLFQKGNAVVRYRIVNEICKNNILANISELKEELLASNEVKTWLSYFNPSEVDLKNYHGSINTCFENYMNKLVNLGLHAGIKELDEKTLPLRSWFTNMTQKNEDKWDTFAMIIFAASFLRAGYRDEAIITFLNKRLPFVYDFTKLSCYDLYDSAEKYKGIPLAFKEKPIIKPNLYNNGMYRYPLIFDIYGFASMMDSCNSNDVDKITNIIDYILSKEYQALPSGYGILAAPGGKYYNMGWDVKLPCFNTLFTESDKCGALLLQRLELMAHFNNAVKSQWFVSAVSYLETFKTVDGTYILPKQFLIEKEGYWVSGMHMGLGENRKQRLANEIESTFWILKIKNIAGI